MKHKHEKDCRKLLASISDYVDGSLEAGLCQELERHLADCEDCQVVVDTFRKTVELYHTEPAPAVPEEVRRRLFKRLQIEDLLPPAQEQRQ